MPDRSLERWRELIADALTRPPEVVIAQSPVGRVKGISEAVVADCSDMRRYVVKGRQVRRGLVADQVVGRLGAMIEAPVADVALVDVPAPLVVEGSYFSRFEPGVGHGSAFIPGCFDSRDVAFEFEEENTERFALLAVLYGWTEASDHQFLYRKSPPRIVHSVDHGAFFAGGTDWSVESLAVAEDRVATPDEWVAVQSLVGGAALNAAIERVGEVEDDRIAEAVAAPPDAWGVTLDERVALARYLARRRDELLSSGSRRS